VSRLTDFAHEAIEMTALPADLTHLGAARSPAAEYYAPLLVSGSELVRVGAWCALLDREAVVPQQYPTLLGLCSYGAIQARAYRFFEGNWDHDLAAEAAEMAASREADADDLARKAELACDEQRGADAEHRRFLATGRFDALVALVEKTEQAGGWRAALPVAVDVLVLTPHEPIAADILLRLIDRSGDTKLLRAVLDQLKSAALHPYLVMLYEAASSLAAGDAVACQKLLRTLDAARPPRADIVQRIRPTALRLNAEAFETLGDFKAALVAYTELKKSEQTGPPGDEYYRLVRAATAQAIPPLPADLNSNHVVMTGFPRSGTTLLENALAAHPRIETYEEIPAVSSMQLLLARELPGAASEAEAVAICLRARERYYDEEQRRHRKDGADIFIDKMPMRSSEAKLLMKMFPEKRYVFSIRHPYDVVLSCFKQRFSRNIAMQQFDSFEGATRLYDFSMSQWFEAHRLDDPKVHYLRYDDLVTSFEPSVRGVLEFLGADWDPAVLGFAELADKRFARTPSYQKVRQGLAIGVQSSWRNYGFLFKTPAARPLAKWVEFFGYSADLTS
jgi:Sulfotransferase family